MVGEITEGYMIVNEEDVDILMQVYESVSLVPIESSNHEYRVSWVERA